jgi:predicted TIM-barrel fold metal-dependent hydrolase
MIFDCHANCGWDMNNTRKNLYPVELGYKQLLNKMQDSGVNKSIIVPFPSPSAQFNPGSFWYEVENHYLILASKFSKNLIPFPGVNPADELSVKMIKTLAVAYSIKGIKFSHQIPMNFSIDKLVNHPLMKIVQKFNLIMMIHIGTGKEQGADKVHVTLPDAIKVAKAYPRVKFIFCHLGRLHHDLFDALKLPNVYTDTSGLALQEKWLQFVAKEPHLSLHKLKPVAVIEKLVQRGFSDKIIFGSDYPYTTYTAQKKHILDADIPEIDKRKIFYGNMAGLLK